MIYRIKPSNLGGKIGSMPSKSMSHRLAIASVLAGNSKIKNLGKSNDIDATLGALKALGWIGFEMTGDNNCLQTTKSFKNTSGGNVHCDESGSTLRILLPLAMDANEWVFTGTKRLIERSQEVYEKIAQKQGIIFERKDNAIRVCGKLKPGEFRIRGDISSQFISGLLFALPTLEADSTIYLQGDVESRGYIDLTIRVLESFGIKAVWLNEKSIFVEGNQVWKSSDEQVEGDYSHAAFFLIAGAISGKIEVSNLREDSFQGDKAIISILEQSGAVVEKSETGFVTSPASLTAVDIDARQIPDLVPILCVLGTASRGTMRIFGAERLRDKESDRLEAISRELNGLGASITQKPDGLIIKGVGGLNGGKCYSHNDHRIAMSLAIASTICKNDIVLDGVENVSKSAPQFWNEFKTLGGIFSELKE